MAFLTVENIELKGIAACVPKNSESNLDYDWITVPERELLIKTTGIKHRRVAGPEICTSDMCYHSAVKLLEELHCKKEDIEIVIFVSQSPDYYLPATAIILQDRLQLPKTTMAFDIQLGCSGYIYGLSVIGTLMQSGGFKKGLLLTGDKSSFSQSKKDKSTYPIFGDAGTATLLEYDPTSKNKITFNLQSDGSGKESIMIKDGGTRYPITADSYKMEEFGSGVIRSRRDLILDGIEVFNFSMREVAPNINALLQYNHSTISDYDYFVFHQANRLINEGIRKKLKVEPEKVPYSLHDYGNTSSASIPLTIVTQLAEQVKNKETRFFLSGFGVGLSWASACLQTKNLICPPIIEI